MNFVILLLMCVPLYTEVNCVEVKYSMRHRERFAVDDSDDYDVIDVPEGFIGAARRVKRDSEIFPTIHEEHWVILEAEEEMDDNEELEERKKRATRSKRNIQENERKRNTEVETWAKENIRFEDHEHEQTKEEIEDDDEDRDKRATEFKKSKNARKDPRESPVKKWFLLILVSSLVVYVFGLLYCTYCCCCRDLSNGFGCPCRECWSSPIRDAFDTYAPGMEFNVATGKFSYHAITQEEEEAVGDIVEAGMKVATKVCPAAAPPI